MRMHNGAAGALGIALAIATHAPAGARAEDRAAEILGAARKALGGRTAEELKSLSVQATMQRNVGNYQRTADVELLIELPDKYVRTEVMSGPMSAELRSGFNGDRSLQSGGQMGMSGGAIVVRIGPGGPMPAADAPKPTPEQLEGMNRAGVRSARNELSRLMLGWFGMAHPSIAPQYTYYGEAESPDGKAYVIDVKGADGFEARLFIDQQSRLPLMLTYQAPQPRMITSAGPRGAGPAVGGAASEEERKKMQAEFEKELEELRTQPPPMAEHSLFFSEWKPVDGLTFPHRITRSTDGTVTEEWTIDRVRVNPKIDAKKFAPQS